MEYHHGSIIKNGRLSEVMPLGLCSASLMGGSLLREINETFLTVIQKTARPEQVSKF